MLVSFSTLVAGCARPKKISSTPSGGPAWTVPAGCEQNLSGLYEHSKDSSFRYRVKDAGRHVRVEVLRPDSSNLRLELERTPVGLVGQTFWTGFNAARQSCPVQFPTTVTSCDAKGFDVETAGTMSVDEACQPDPQAAGGELERHRLNRIAVGDGGVTSAVP